MFQNMLRRTLFSIPHTPGRKEIFRKISSEVGGTRQIENIEKSFNQVILLGRVGRDPEKRGTEEKPVVTFSMATNFNYSSKDGEIMQQTEWHRISIFRPYLQEKVTRYMTKGSRIMITGRISYMDRKDVNNPDIIYKIATIIADDIIFIGKVPDSKV